MKRALNNGQSASATIQKLYELYARDVYRYAWFILGNPTQAEDVLQEVYLRALRSWERFRGDSQEKTWIMTIARNYIYDSHRKKESENKYLHSHKNAAVPDEFTETDDMIVLQDALLRLKRKYRQTIALRYIEQFSIKETAQILGWSQAKVRSTTHRAIQQLREILGSEQGGETP